MKTDISTEKQPEEDLRDLRASLVLLTRTLHTELGGTHEGSGLSKNIQVQNEQNE